MNNKDELTPKAMSLNIINRMKYGGSSPFHQTFCLKCIAYIYVLIYGSFVFLSILNIIVSSDLTATAVMDQVIFIVGYIQIAAKYYFASEQAKNFRHVLEMIFKEFWPIENGILNKDEEKNMRFLYRIAKNCATIYGLSAYSTVTLLATHVIHKHAFIISIWIPNKEILTEHPYYEIMIAFQILALYTAVHFSVVQVDILFIYFICFLYVQLKILQKKLTTIVKDNSFEENYNILKECVQHHNRLIRFLQYTNKVYAKILLPTVFTNFFMFTLTIYGLQAEGSINGKVKNLLIFITILFQLCAYCYGGQIIQDQGAAIGETIYELTNWYEIRDISIKKAFIMMVMQSQKPMQLSVAGMLNFDMRCLAMVIRSCFSFMTFLANVR